jgi:hypothetical protein
MVDELTPEMLAQLDKNLAFAHNQLIELVELNDDGLGRGAGTVTFNVKVPCLCVRLPRNVPIKWLSEKKCADYAILEFSPIGINLHLVELKSKMTVGVWNHCKQQFTGALHNARAIGGVLQLPTFLAVRLHVAYSTDAISPQRTTAPSSLKNGLGVPIVGAGDWVARRVELGPFRALPLALIPRDSYGNATAILGD